MINKCIICGRRDSKIVHKNYPGYIEGTFFNIYKCNYCDSHFIITEEDIKYIYDIIYSNTNTSGYDRYYQYASIIKNINDPIKYLAYNESSYYPVYDFVKSKNQLKILEVGCGYGYLSYSLFKAGFRVIAIDIAKEAINFARENFGDFFYNVNLKEYSKQTDEKFDLIIATEVIEHLEDPNNFLETCIQLLEQEGQIILTTPNKDYSHKNSIWQTDLPPVHLSWIGEKGINVLAKKNNLSVKTQDFTKYYSNYENRLVKYFVSRKEKILGSILTKQGAAIMREAPSLLHNIISQIAHKIPIIRFLSNLVYNLFNGNDMTMGVILTRIVKQNIPEKTRLIL